MANKKYTIILNEKLQEKIAEICEKTGFDTVSDVVRLAIGLAHKEYVNNYVEVAKKNIELKEELLTPEGQEKKILTDIEMADQKKAIKEKKDEDDQRKICSRLKGDVETGEGGLYCRFKNYTYMGPGKTQHNTYSVKLRALNMISELDINRQFTMDPKYTVDDALENCITKSPYSL